MILSTPKTKEGEARRDWLLGLSGESGGDELLQKDAYISPEFLKVENERLWPRIWQVACREEEIPHVGDFVAYDIQDESIVVIRSAPDKISAYYNVCQHRGRRLVKGHGHITQFQCGNHAWRWNLDGTCAEILHESDWLTLCKADVPLKKIKVDTWGGYVYVNMDPNSEPLLDYLAPVPEFLDPYHFERMRFRWYKTVIIKCNWKTAMDAFIEGYHQAGTHPQLLRYTDDRIHGFRRGKHSHYRLPPDATGIGQPSPILGAAPEDPRRNIYDFVHEIMRDLDAMWTPRDLEAVKSVLDLPEGTNAKETYAHFAAVGNELAKKEGADGWTITPDEMRYAGVNWHIFPNQITLPTHNGALCYRSRPWGNDPNVCIFDIWSLALFPPGKEPMIRREFYPEWDAKALGRILTQDNENMVEMQRGMHSRGFEGSRPSPVQEVGLSNYHKVLRQYLFGDMPRS